MSLNGIGQLTKQNQRGIVYERRFPIPTLWIPQEKLKKNVNAWHCTSDQRLFVMRIDAYPMKKVK